MFTRWQESFTRFKEYVVQRAVAVVSMVTIIPTV